MHVYHIGYVCSSSGGFGTSNSFSNSTLRLQKPLTEKDLEDFKTKNKMTWGDGIAIVSIFKFENQPAGSSQE
jgi:hypothetical protein